jgi:hypothetical protein
MRVSAACRNLVDVAASKRQFPVLLYAGPAHGKWLHPDWTSGSPCTVLASDVAGGWLTKSCC